MHVKQKKKKHTNKHNHKKKNTQTLKNTTASTKKTTQDHIQVRNQCPNKTQRQRLDLKGRKKYSTILRYDRSTMSGEGTFALVATIPQVICSNSTHKQENK